MIDEVLILFTAGHETTANALSFTFFLLGKHPEIQEKVLQEVKQAGVGTTDGMTWVPKMVYTQQCIEEAMRLYPPAYIIDRMAKEDLEIANYRFTKGSLLLMSVYELHRYKNFWDEPESYVPERFDKVNKKEMGAYYYPFGAGPRMCIGNNFAMNEMIMTIAHIVKKYRIRNIDEEVKIVPLITLKPKEVVLNFQER